LLSILEQRAEIAAGEGARARRRDGRVVVGMVGYPNVGKSSTVNALVAKKVRPCAFPNHHIPPPFAHTRTRRHGYLCPACLSIHRDILVPEGTITLTVCPYIAIYKTDTFLLIPEENRRQRDAR
jgi:hypothetical protein